jgi:hypothetical protein
MSASYSNMIVRVFIPESLDDTLTKYYMKYYIKELIGNFQATTNLLREREFEFANEKTMIEMRNIYIYIYIYIYSFCSDTTWKSILRLISK